MSHQKGVWETELDLDSEARLRELFVQAADRYNPTSRVRNYAEWRLDVHKVNEQRRDLRGPRLAQVTVDGAGRTVVKR